MKKKELIIEVKKVLTEALELRTPLNTEITEKIYEGIVNLHVKELVEFEETTIPKVGKLVVKERSARVVKNPKTGEEINVPAKKVIRLRATKSLKEKVNN